MGLQHWCRSFYGKYLKINRPRRRKLRLVLEMKHVLVLGVRSVLGVRGCWEWVKIWCWKWGGNPQTACVPQQTPNLLRGWLFAWTTHVRPDQNPLQLHPRVMKYQAWASTLSSPSSSDLPQIHFWGGCRVLAQMSAPVAKTGLPHRRWVAFRAKKHSMANDFFPFKKTFWRNNLISKNYHSMSIYSGNVPATAGTRSIHTSHFAALLHLRAHPLSVSILFFFPHFVVLVTSLLSSPPCFQLPFSILLNVEISQLYFSWKRKKKIYIVWYTHIFGYLITIGNLLVHHRFGIVFRWKMDKTVIITIIISRYKPQNSCQ